MRLVVDQADAFAKPVLAQGDGNLETGVARTDDQDGFLCHEFKLVRYEAAGCQSRVAYCSAAAAAPPSFRAMPRASKARPIPPRFPAAPRPVRHNHEWRCQRSCARPRGG